MTSLASSPTAGSSDPSRLPAAPGRRERKKAATRRAIADAALRLFLERGYDQVSLKDVAEAADVAGTTVFKHFSGKEALVFDEDADQEAALVAAVTQRVPGRSVLDALRAHLLDWATRRDSERAELTAFLRLVDSTPALRAYSRSMWTRHEHALARAVAATTGADPDDVRCAALARLVLEAVDFASTRPDPHRALAEALDLLRTGWHQD